MNGVNWQKVRVVVQIFFVILILYLSVGHYFEENYSLILPGAASIHAICPLGGVETLYTFITSGDFVQKIHQADMIMMVALLLILIIGGASFCGWICPLGTVQEWIGKLGKKLFKKRYNKIINGKIDKVLRNARYLVLFIVVFNTARTLKLVFQDYDPYYNLFNIWTGEISVIGYIVVAVTLLLSLIIERPFCRYACPLGAINGLFNKISIFNIKRSDKSCIHCNKCNNKCPSGINVSGSNIVSDTTCIRCLKCEDSCPVNNLHKKPTLSLKTIWSKSEGKGIIRNVLYVSLTLLVFVGTIVLAAAFGQFSTVHVSTYDTISDIRGSSTIQQLLDNYPITMMELEKGYAVAPTIPFDTKIKDISEYMGIDRELEIISPEKIREVIEYLDRDVTEFAQQIEVDIAKFKVNLFSTNIDGLTLREYIDNSRKGSLAYLMGGFWPQDIVGQETNNAESNLNINDPIEEGVSQGLVENIDSPTIRGSTTLAEIKNMKIDFDKLTKKFEIPEDIDINITLRELKDEYGMEVSEIREYILQME